jgi:predicted ester cyclase
MPGTDNRGLKALRLYHDSFFAAFFSAFPDIQIEIMQQVAEGDRMATYITSQGTHSGMFSGLPPTGKHISTAVIRIDRVQNGKLTEHWSVSDAAGLLLQIQA